MKKQLGQFYTTNANYIIGNLLKDIPNGSIIDPFAGNKDLLDLYPKGIGYDIDPKFEDIIKQDTLLYPPLYNNFWVITNPPYLAKNKSKQKYIYEKYNVNDLYKASMLSIIGCEGGILIVPVNFLCDEDDNFRKIFLSKYKILNMNVFEESVFDDTDQIVCSFSFIKKQNEKQEINICYYPDNCTFNYTLEFKNGYRIGNDFYSLINSKNLNSKIKISRLVKGDIKKYSNIFLYGVDTGSKNGRIRLEYRETPFYGKNTDRSFATICFSGIELDNNQQKYIISRFNELIEIYRKQYRSMFLTNFRNATKSYSRKRISFQKTFKLINYIITNEIL